MSDTGGFINIGIVFSKEQSFNQNLYALIDSFVSQGSSLIKLKFSENEEGTRWIEKQIINNKVTVDLNENYYSFIELSGNALGINSDEIKLSPVIEKDFHGFLIDIKWDDMFPLPHNSDTVVSRTNKLIRFLIDSYKLTTYSYAIVGSELDIELSPEEFMDEISSEDYFPLALVGDNSKVQIHRGSHHIDGITPQRKNIETINL